MADRKRKRISTDGGEPLAQNPFGMLDSSGLPDFQGEAGGQEDSGGLDSAPWRGMRVILRRETAHRGGKVVTIVDGLEGSAAPEAIDALLKDIRRHCGCGATVKEGVVEVQGEQVRKLRAYLEGIGCRIAGEK